MNESVVKILAAAIAIAVVLYIVKSEVPTTRDEFVRQDAPKAPAKDNSAVVTRSAPPPIPDRIPIESKKPSIVIAVAAPAPATKSSAKKVPATPEPPEIKPFVPHDVAREALAYVGVDGQAEALWVQAINDPALTKHQRSNLIEDLNEDGFPDPKNITVADLPLIQSRMQIIEHLAPDSMDEVNYDAFAEAYKDLTNMVKKLGIR